MLTRVKSVVRISGVACFALGLSVIVASTAQASLDLSIDTGSGFVLQDTTGSGGVVTFSGSQDGVDFDLVSGKSNSPGAPPQAKRNITTLDIINNSGSSKIVQILVGDTGFTFPGIGPVRLTSSLGGSVGVSGVNSVTYQTWVDPSNTQDGMGGITAGPLFADTSAVGNGEALPTLQASLNALLTGSPFSFTGLVILDLADGAAVNFATTAVLAPVPEASSLLVWGAMLIPVGLVVRRSYVRHNRS